MKAYKPVSACANVTATVSSAFYTVPVGRIAKLTYAFFSSGMQDKKSYVKVNDNTASTTNAILVNTNDIDVIVYGTSGSVFRPSTHPLSEKGMYLNEGDSLYLYSTITESVFISLIEEYEV